MAEANLRNPDGTINTDGVVAELQAVQRAEPDAMARQQAYNDAFAAGQASGKIPQYGWKDEPGHTPRAYVMYLNQQLNPGGELPLPGLTATTVPLPEPGVS